MNKKLVSNLSPQETHQIIAGSYGLTDYSNCETGCQAVCPTVSFDPNCQPPDITLSPQGCWRVLVWTACGFC